MKGDGLFKTVVVVGVCLHANHEVHVAACRRKEHPIENQPVQAIDMGVTKTFSAITTPTTLGGGVGIGGTASVGHYVAAKGLWV